MLTETLTLDAQRQALRCYKDSIMLLEHVCEAGRRPYIHPLRPLDGKGVLTQDSPDHHPWQHGLYTGLHGVNGSDFWFDQGEKVGRIEVQPPTLLSDDSWQIQSLWRHHQGHPLLQEDQQWHIHLSNNLMLLDMQWVLTAACDLHIEQCSYGGLFLRMPFTKEKDVHVVNSRFQENDDCEQAEAEWVAIHMDIDGRDNKAGIAFMDHPKNQKQTALWRVDSQRGINPSPCISSALDLREGASKEWRYRIAVFSGALDQDSIAQAYAAYAQE